MSSFWVLGSIGESDVSSFLEGVRKGLDLETRLRGTCQGALVVGWAIMLKSWRKKLGREIWVAEQ